MATVRITGNWKNMHSMDWAGAPQVDPSGHIDRSIPISEEAFQAVERQIATGANEGIIFLPNGTRFDWFLDGSLTPAVTKPRPAPPAGWNALERMLPLLPEIQKIGKGELDGSAHQREIIQLLALLVAEELKVLDGKKS
jgi:hypothetical protein